MKGPTGTLTQGVTLVKDPNIEDPTWHKLGRRPGTENGNGLYGRDNKIQSGSGLERYTGSILLLPG